VTQDSTLVDQAGSTLLDVVRSIGCVTVIMGEISTASAAQSKDITLLGSAVMLLDEATQHNAALVEEVAAAATSMRSEALDLVQTVALFSLPQGAEYGVAELSAPVVCFELWG
jgi:methyl-accepting chemotaxis protein